MTTPTECDGNSTTASPRVEAQKAGKAADAEAKERSINDVKVLDEKAEEFKAKGNENFKIGHYVQAIGDYSKAIDLCEENDHLPATSLHIYYTNRAFCHLKMENYGSAIMDAERAIEVKPGFTKAMYRRGCAYMLLQKYKDAKKDFTAVCKLSNDADAASRLKECDKQIKQQKFAEAIASEKTAKISEGVNIEDMMVEASYAGPKYETGKADGKFLEELVEYIKKPGNVLHKKYAYAVVMDMIKMLKELKSLVRINVPAGEEFTICGDVHGQYYDLCNIWQKLNGMPSEKNGYLFNGDFVDRGSFSIECIIALFCAKLAFPNHVHLARGNHETKNMNKMYGFEGEVVSKYDQRLYELFSEAFCLLPLAHVVNDKILVVHGGLFSKDGVKLQDIEQVSRDREPPDEGIMVELLWSDPGPMMGRAPSKRGVGVSFGPDVTRKFLEDNNLGMVVRSHEMKEEGYEIEHGGKLCTVFSAPNYCDQMGNKGAYIRLKSKGVGTMPEMSYKSFEAVPHPPVKPMKYANPIFNFM